MGTVLNPFGVIIIGSSLDQSQENRKGGQPNTIQNRKSREKERQPSQPSSTFVGP